MTEQNKERLSRIKHYERIIERETGKTVKSYRSDGYVNMMNRYGTQKDSSEQYIFAQEPIVDDSELTINYEGNGIFAKIIDTPAEEAIKHGFELKGVTDEKIIKFYTEALDELDWEETAMTALKWSRLFGGSIAVMLINDGRGLEEPVNWRAIRSIDDIRVYDRSVIQPDYQSMFTYDPKNPFGSRASRLGTPEFYDINSRFGSFRVHDSRCLVFTNGVLPENCSNSNYLMWGMPEYVRINRAIKNAEIAHGTAPKMLDRSVQAVYRMKGLSELMMTEEGEDLALRRLQVIDMARGLLNSIAIDSEGEDYDFRSFSYAGVKDVIDTTCNFLSAVTSIPQTVLFGRSPAGMNATGQGDMENYYNYVERIQKRVVRKNLRYLLSIIFQAGKHTGEIDKVPKIDIEFSPLWSMTETEKVALAQQKAQVQLTNAQTAQTYVSMGALDSTEVRDKLASEDEFTIDTIIDASDIENDYVKAMMEIEQKQNQPQMGMPGMEAGNPAEMPGMGGNENPQTMPEGNAPDAAPTATKLPQDMSPAEQEATKTDAESRGSVGVLVEKDGKILVGIRKNDTGRGLICGPGGHIEPGEDALTAAIRETQEEFGITPTNIIEIGKGPWEPESGLQPVIFLCTEYEGELLTDDEEMSSPVFLDLETIEKLKPSLFQPFADSVNILRLILDKEEKEQNRGESQHIDKTGICDIISLRDFIRGLDAESNFDASKKRKKQSNTGGSGKTSDGDVSWITTKNGVHIPIDEEGKAQEGSPLAGKDFSDAKTEQRDIPFSDEVGTIEKPSARGTNVSCQKFEDEQHLNQHWDHPNKGHGWQFPDFKNAMEYQKGAEEFLKQPCGGDIDGYLSYYTNPDGTKELEVCRFNRKTGEYAKGIPGKRIKTYFIAKYDKGKDFDIEKAIKYFEKRKSEEAFVDGGSN